MAFLFLSRSILWFGILAKKKRDNGVTICRAIPSTDTTFGIRYDNLFNFVHKLYYHHEVRKFRFNQSVFQIPIQGNHFCLLQYTGNVYRV